MNNEQIYVDLVANLEIIGRRFLEVKWKGMSDLFQIQIDLLDYQVDLESKAIELRAHNKIIKNLKGTESYKRLDGWEERSQVLKEESQTNDNLIDVYNHVRSIAKKLGNAFAYYFLQGNESLILSLARNTRPWSMPNGHVLESVKRTAALYHDVGAGFPVIHDMTDLLRIGDITIIHAEYPPITIELKTHQGKDNPKHLIVESHYVDAVPEGNQKIPVGAKRFEEITKHLKVVMHNDSQEFPPLNSSTDRPFVHLKDRDPRQANRMADARLWQQAEPNKVFKVRGERAIVMEWTPQGKMAHWDVVTRLIKEARSSSYAQQSVDGAFLYVAIYDPQPMIFGVSEENPSNWMTKTEKLPTDLIQSGIFYDDPAKNTLFMGSSSTALDDEVSPFVRPIFSYPLPVDDLMDLLKGRLQILVFINLGKLVEALEAIGIQAELTKDKKRIDKRVLSLRMERTLDTGQEVSAYMGNMHVYVEKIIHEFLSLDAFIDLVKGMADGAIQAMSDESAAVSHGASENPM